MKKISKYQTSWTSIAKPNELDKFKRKILLKPINQDLIEFIEDKIKGLIGIDEKMLYLHFAKKELLHTERRPDFEHFVAFEDNYMNDRQNFNPIKWIDVELEFWTNIKLLNSNQQTSSEIAQAKLTLSKSWLTQEEVQDMFKFSRTTLNRRIAEGMPCHQKGKFKFFNLEEVSEWLKEDEAV
ncbi:helix-turn-helix domain-containing protein [Pedobacter cryophilus]|uniref:Helix-turn-helix domain-containing protein n=1 Tax=Pedobacter cryophilus TaxID=2571271 RepID=A0A4U1BUS6_9SPHI|nr:helix-turn-helix domain-containing protein [Pedobacter cryophilus]TKB95741.1 helix-turn-helix domain-containing protein [Pedobacter cryophilus]